MLSKIFYHLHANVIITFIESQITFRRFDASDILGHIVSQLNGDLSKKSKINEWGFALKMYLHEWGFALYSV